MSDSFFQGAAVVQVYSPQGARPLDALKVIGSVKKEYDKACKSQVIIIDTSSTGSRVVIPKEPTKALLVHPVVVFQLCTQLASPISAEITVVDGLGKRRLMFSSNFPGVQVHPQHAKIPLRLPPNVWLNVFIDVKRLYSAIYDRKGTIGLRGVESIAVGSACRLRKIFTLKELPQSDAEIPSSVEFPSGVDHGSIFIGDVDEIASESSNGATPASAHRGQMPPPSARGGNSSAQKGASSAAGLSASPAPPPASAPAGASRFGALPTVSTPLQSSPPPSALLFDASDVGSNLKDYLESQAQQQQQVVSLTKQTPPRVQSAPHSSAPQSSVKKSSHFDVSNSRAEELGPVIAVVGARNVAQRNLIAGAPAAKRHQLFRESAESARLLGEEIDRFAANVEFCVASDNATLGELRPVPSPSSRLSSSSQPSSHAAGSGRNSMRSSGGTPAATVETSSSVADKLASTRNTTDASVVESIAMSGSMGDGNSGIASQKQPQHATKPLATGKVSGASSLYSSSVIDACSSVPFDTSVVADEQAVHDGEDTSQRNRIVNASRDDAFLTASILSALERIAPSRLRDEHHPQPQQPLQSRRRSAGVVNRMTIGGGDDDDDDSFVVHRPRDFYEDFNMTGYEDMVLDSDSAASSSAAVVAQRVQSDPLSVGRSVAHTANSAHAVGAASVGAVSSGRSMVSGRSTTCAPGKQQQDRGRSREAAAPGGFDIVAPAASSVNPTATHARLAALQVPPAAAHFPQQQPLVPGASGGSASNDGYVGGASAVGGVAVGDGGRHSRAGSRDGMAPLRYVQQPRPTSSGGIPRKPSRCGRPVTGGRHGENQVFHDGAVPPLHHPMVPQTLGAALDDEYRAIIDINADPNGVVVLRSLGALPQNADRYSEGRRHHGRNQQKRQGREMQQNGGNGADESQDFNDDYDDDNKYNGVDDVDEGPSAPRDDLLAAVDSTSAVGWGARLQTHEPLQARPVNPMALGAGGGDHAHDSSDYSGQRGAIDSQFQHWLSDHLSGTEGSTPDDMSPDRFQYDPVLRCYFDRMTNQYASAMQYGQHPLPHH